METQQAMSNRYRISTGWQEHLDKRGTPCVYCQRDSTMTLVVVPDEWRGAELHRRGVRVGTCYDHYREPDSVATAVNFRRVWDRVHEQLRLPVL